MIRKVTIWIYLVYQWGLVMISQKLWNTVWIRLGGMNVQPALGFTRVPDDLSPFSPLALATFGEGPSISNPGWIDQKQLYNKMIRKYWMIFQKSFDSGWIDQPLMSFSEGRSGLFNGSWPLDESTNHSDNNACHHISVLDGFRRLNRNQYVYCWVMMGTISYYLHVSMSYCLTAQIPMVVYSKPPHVWGI